MTAQTSLSTSEFADADADAMVKMLSDTGALLYGEFTLVSGKTSSYYFDSKLLTMDPVGARAVGGYFVNKLRFADAQAVGGMAVGAIPLVSAVTAIGSAEGYGLPSFYVRKEPKSHGTQNLIEGKFPDDPNAPVAIMDDVVTAGGSILQAIDAVETRGNPITEVMCILDRNEGGRERLQERGYELKAMFSVEDGEIRFNP